MNSFKLIVLTFFAICAVIGVAIFATGGFGANEGEQLGQVEMWGTLEKTKVNDWIGSLNNKDLEEAISYKQKSKDTYYNELINALASGKSPDLFILPQDKILQFRDKIYPIPYENFSKRKFKDEFISEGELYLGEEGIYGLPLLVDPLIMYWNRDMFSVSGISEPPKYWDEIFLLSEKISIKNKNLDILQSTVALGEYSNIKHAKEIISAMIFQADGEIVDYSGSALTSLLSSEFSEQKEIPAISALRYYTDFSNPAKSIYSWNISLKNARDAFISGDLAIYFGFASEIYSISKSNPNLDFDVASLPKRDRMSGETYGEMLAVAIPKGTDNHMGTFLASTMLSSKSSVEVMSSEFKIPPARRDLLSSSPEEDYLSVFYKSALNSKGWLDPEPEETEKIFKDMINYITSGSASISKAVQTASREIDNLLK